MSEVARPVLAALLAEALRTLDGQWAIASEADEADALLATPAGRRIAAVVEAAVAWRRSHSSNQQYPPDVALRDAVDGLQG